MALLTITTAGLRPLPLSLISQAIPLLSRGELEDVVERLIDELDRRDGDVDLEDCHDLEGSDGDSVDIAWPEWSEEGQQIDAAVLTGGTFGTPFLPTEDDEDSDPCGDPLDELGETQSDDGAELLKARPRYGSDQSLGPINERQAVHAHHLAPLRPQRREVRI